MHIAVLFRTSLVPGGKPLAGFANPIGAGVGGILMISWTAVAGVIDLCSYAESEFLTFRDDESMFIAYC